MPAEQQPARERFAFISGLGFGGATTFLANLAVGLSNRGIPVAVFSLERENACESEFGNHSISVTVQDNANRIFEDRLEATLRALREFQPTAVVACLGQSSYEVLRYVPHGIKRVAMIHADHEIFYEALAPYVEVVDAFIGVSDAICEKLARFCDNGRKSVHCLTSGVPLPDAVPSRTFPADQPLRILYLGRLEEGQKRVHLFPQILKQLIQSEIPFTWTIAGEGSERSRLEKEMLSERPDQVVRFLGGVPYGQVPALLTQNDVFLLASDAEGLPMSLMEAASFGLVPVLSDLSGGVGQVTTAESGIPVDPQDIPGYASAIVWLHHHRDRMSAMSEAGRQTIRERFSVTALAERWISALSNPCSKAVIWPDSWRIRGMLSARQSLYFLPIFRPFRRLALRLRRRTFAQRPSSPT